MNDDTTDEGEAPARPPKPSLAPSWAMLGFVFGAVFMWALPRPAAPPPPVYRTPAPEPERQPAARPRLMLIEDVFAEWNRFAIWENGLTEVALWNTEKKSYAECYEVLLSGEDYFFRTIPHLTRPVLTHGVPVGSPLQFTETPARRDEWLRERSQLTLRALSEAAQQNIPVVSSPKPGEVRK